MYSTINEPITTLTLFSPKGINPILLKWKNQKLKIKKINFVYQSQKGDSKILHFSVSTKTDTYHISFNTNDLKWRMENVLN